MKRWILAVGVVVLFSGCVNIQTMALKKGQGALSTATHSIVLMTVEVSRADESRYQPTPTIIWVTDRNSGAKDQSLRFQLYKKGDMVELDGRSTYLTSLALTPGRYQLEGISGIAAAFPFVGQFFIPILADFVVKPESIRYAGHLSATMRERREGEFRAGSVIPLIDQSATGMINHSWEVVIDDRSGQDIETFREHVPALIGLDIDDEAFPAWDRAAAQRRWDGKAEPEPEPEPESAMPKQAAAGTH